MTPKTADVVESRVPHFPTFTLGTDSTPGCQYYGASSTIQRSRIALVPTFSEKVAFDDAMIED
jgi:hypothetical protein